jgi:hypothetical protein
MIHLVIRTSPSKNGAVKVTFVLPTQQPNGRVSVVGDFNEWRPGTHELKKRSNDTRSVSLEVIPGTTLCFRYLATDDVWLDEPDAHGWDHRGSVYTAN